MSLQEQLTADQLKVVVNAPLAAAAYVSTASGGAWEMIKEMTSVSKFLAQQVQTGASSEHGELVDEILGVLKGMSKDDAKAHAMPFEKSNDVSAMRAQLKQAVADSWAALSALPGADGFAQWILEVGRTAALTKTGGHFGIGNKSVIDPQEQAALDELAAVMTTAAAE